MSDTGEPIPKKNEWQYNKKEIVTPKDFLKDILTTMQGAEVCSFGEYHDERTDPSYSFLLNHMGEILDIYHYYKGFRESPKPAIELSFDRLLRLGSTLVEELDKANPSMAQLQKMHVGRLFGLAILPLARYAGYTDLVLEGVDEINPGTTLERSKDQIGDLLRLTTAMRLGMNIHGAYDTGRFPTGKGVADALWSKIKDIKEKTPETHVIVYNGALHNMTEPSQGEVSEGFLKYDASELTYAPQARKLWGDKFRAIDLLNGDRLLPQSHFRYMQDQAQPDAITRFSHGINQQTYVLT